MSTNTTPQQRAAAKAAAKKWDKIAGVILILQAILSFVALAFVLISDMFPLKYLIAIIVILFLLWFLVFLMVYLVQHVRGKSRSKKKSLKALGTTLSAFTMIICILVTYYIGILKGTINGITEDQTVIMHEIGVYVLASDPVASLDDMAGYTYGYSTANDGEFTMDAINDLSERLNTTITPTEYGDLFTMADAMRSGEITAMCLNTSFIEMYEDIEGYETFGDEIRLVEVIQEEEIVEPEEEVDVDVTTQPFIVYISGSDTRSSKLSTSRSDVNIMAVVNPTTHQVLLLNTPRDCWLVNTASSSGSYDKLTHCGLYGVDCSMDSLGQFYGCEISYYVQINFTGFETLVDALGGITVYSDASFSSSVDEYIEERGEISFTEGENELDGLEALAFVRERHNLADGDYARGRHQMAAISAIIDKMTSPTILTNYGDIMSSLEGMFVTNFSSDDISSLVKMQLDDGGSWNVKSFNLLGEGGREYTYSMPNTSVYVMYADEDGKAKAEELIQKVYNGETLTDEDLQY